VSLHLFDPVDDLDGVLAGEVSSMIVLLMMMMMMMMCPKASGV
jgi:hypothetical protein